MSSRQDVFGPGTVVDKPDPQSNWCSGRARW